MMIRLCLFLLIAATGCQLIGPDFANRRTADADRLQIVHWPTPIEGPDDAVDVTGLALQGDSLRVMVRYSGGCAEHAFRLYWDGSVAESYPPQATLLLSHDDRDDACDAVVSAAVSFDVAELFERVGDRFVVIHARPLGEGEGATLRP